MGWTTKANGRRYLYRTFRRDGRVVCKYVGRDDEFTRDVLAFDLRVAAEDKAELRRTLADQSAAFRGRMARLESLGRGDDLKAVAGGLMALAGFHNPGRKGWRMSRGALGKMARQIETMKAQLDRQPLLRFNAHESKPEAVAVFAAARAGDQAAIARLPQFLRAQGYVEWIGDLGRQATHQLVGRVGRNDPVFRAGVEAKAADLWAELAGPDPTVLESLLVRRVVNGWLVVYVTEIELALATENRQLDFLERMLGRSQKRMGEAVRELARVRRLQAPQLVRRLEDALDVRPVRAALATSAAPALTPTES